jgi:hypothetical protein
METMATFQKNNLIGLEITEELLDLIPAKLVRQKHRFKGFSTISTENIFSSYFTAGEYYPVEPSILTQDFWSDLLIWVEYALEFEKKDLIACRCQLNVIPEVAKYHPLTIAPHADSLGSNINVAAINIPLQTHQEFLTGFWSHNICGTSLDYKRDFKFDFSSSKGLLTSSTIPNPFATEELLTLINDNPKYVDSSELILSSWRLESIINTKIGSGLLYNGRLFHSPYLVTQKESPLNENKIYRKSLAIFLIFNANVHYPRVTNDESCKKMKFFETLVDSMVLDGKYPTPYIQW